MSVLNYYTFVIPSFEVFRSEYQKKNPYISDELILNEYQVELNKKELWAQDLEMANAEVNRLTVLKLNTELQYEKAVQELKILREKNDELKELYQLEIEEKEKYRNELRMFLQSINKRVQTSASRMRQIADQSTSTNVLQ
eukprot:Lithocolla_globosa_v1_NODE_6352_length_1099_cov_7.116858.p1 type:complete len:140 gc:universal NODE_6352_length_1099_cov_7.116858:541-122(-)